MAHAIGRAAATVAGVSHEPARVALLLDQIGADVERLEERAFAVRVPSERRGAVAALVHADERTLRADAFFMRAPDRDHEAVYRRLLRRNLGPGRWRFAIDDDGDLYLTVRIPLAGLGAAELDELLGELSVTVDESFEGIMRLGFVVPERTDAPPERQRGGVPEAM
jgi:hypothetical protein